MPHTATPPAAAAPLDPAVIEVLRMLMEERVPFNHLIGLRLTGFDPAAPRMRLDMRPELLGNAHAERLHGGVIATVLDAMAGFSIMLALATRHADQPVEHLLQRFTRIGTIDLRIDFLRAARGAWFEAGGTLLRLGNRLASIRMEMTDDHGRLVATGNASFVVD